MRWRIRTVRTCSASARGRSHAAEERLTASVGRGSRAAACSHAAVTERTPTSPKRPCLLNQPTVHSHGTPQLPVTMGQRPRIQCAGRRRRRSPCACVCGISCIPLIREGVTYCRIGFVIDLCSALAERNRRIVFVIDLCSVRWRQRARRIARTEPFRAHACVSPHDPSPCTRLVSPHDPCPCTNLVFRTIDALPVPPAQTIAHPDPPRVPTLVLLVRRL